jgi:hypothetical protein
LVGTANAGSFRHLDLAQQRHARPAASAARERVLQRLLENIPELSLGFGHADFERLSIGSARRRLDTRQHVSDLRSIAVRQQQLRMLVEQRRELLHRLAGETQLAVHCQWFAGRDKGVPPQHGHDPLAARWFRQRRLRDDQVRRRWLRRRWLRRR